MVAGKTMTSPVHALAFAVMATAIASLTAGCGGGGGSGGAGSTPQQACDALSGATIAASRIALPTRGGEVVSTRLVLAGTPDNADGEYCQVEGKIHAADINAQDIHFEIRLPSAWNNKALHVGGGSWDGAIPIGNEANRVVRGTAATPLARGYAVFGSDSGHADPAGLDASFALNDEQLANFGGDQLKKTRDATMDILQRRYGRLPAKTYFVGLSNGGREALVVVQRFPADYDAVLALFPPLAFTPLLMKLNQVAVAMFANHGAGWISPAKAVFLNRSVVSVCDASDGAVDGIVSNPSCTFDYRSLRCPGGADTASDCFSDPQLKTLDALFQRLAFSYALANGVASSGPFSLSANFASDLNILGAMPTPMSAPPSAPEVGLAAAFSDGLIRYAVTRNSTLAPFTFDAAQPMSYLPRLQTVSTILDATNPDISAFKQRGGKLIILHGGADELVPASGTADWYQQLVARFGQAETDAFVRFYRVPGLGHGGGGVFSFSADVLSALEQWSEAGKAPANLTATDANPASAGRTRPLCAYP
ncbi:MAG: tannase/feruloyl esterase family alpha/beta hydrolase, partial [Casimicrobiaceae bacterium]